MTRLINLVMILFSGLMWFPHLKLLAGEELKKKSELMTASILCGVNKI